MIIDITSFGQSTEQPGTPELGGVIDITPQDFTRTNYSEENSTVEEVEETIDENQNEESPENTENTQETEEIEEIEETEEIEDTTEENTSDDSDEENSIGEVKDYFNKATTLNILHTPEGFEWDDEDPYGSLEKVTDFTNNKLLDQVADNFYSQFKDPILRQVVDAALAGGSFMDVAKLITQTEEINTYEKLDVSNEDDATKLYSDYLQSTTKFKGGKINKLLDLAKEDDELEELASEAKEYFLEQAKAEADALTKTALQDKKAAEIRAEEYWTGFYSTLNERQIGDEVKKDIQTSFQVTDNNVFKYQEVFGEVTKNSDHFIDLLMFLNTYDASTGFTYEREERKNNTRTAKSFKERIEKEITRNSSKGNVTSKRNKIVPKRNSYMKNIRTI